MNKEPLIDKETIHSIASFFLSVFLILGIFFIAIDFVAALISGNLLSFVNPLIWYGSWIVNALVCKLYLKRRREEQQIEGYIYALLWLCLIIGIVYLFPYPINIILSLLVTAGFVYSYIAQSKNIAPIKINFLNFMKFDTSLTLLGILLILFGVEVFFEERIHYWGNYVDFAGDHKIAGVLIAVYGSVMVAYSAVMLWRSLKRRKNNSI